LNTIIIIETHTPYSSTYIYNVPQGLEANFKRCNVGLIILLESSNVHPEKASSSSWWQLENKLHRMEKFILLNYHCWIFVLTALLLKQISKFVLLDTMFQHPGTPVCTRVLYYLRKPYFLILLTEQRAYLYRISCAIFLKMWLYFRKYLKLFWTFLKVFLHFRTFHFCHWFVFADQLNNLFCSEAQTG